MDRRLARLALLFALTLSPELAAAQADAGTAAPEAPDPSTEPASPGEASSPEPDGTDADASVPSDASVPASATDADTDAAVEESSTAPEPEPAAPPPEPPAPPPEPTPAAAPAITLPEATAASADVEAGFTAADGAFIRTRDRAWSLRVGLLAQMRVTGSSTPDPTRGFEFVPVLSRLYVQGSAVQPWVRYYFQTEFAGQESPNSALPAPPSPRILDMWVEAQPHEAFGVRVGLMRPFFTRSWIAGLSPQLMFDRTDANAFFRNHGAAGGGTLGAFVDGTVVLPVAWDRDIGATVYGRPAGGEFEYYLGVFNGNGYLFGRNEALSAMPMLRLAVNPLGAMGYSETPALANPHQPLRMQIGFAGYYNDYRVTYQSPSMTTPRFSVGEEQLTMGADVSVQFETVYATGEVYYRNRRTVDGDRHGEAGGYGMIGWMFWAPLLEVAARFSMIDPDLARAGDFRQTYDLELNCYAAGNNLRFGLRYSAAINDATQNVAIGGSAGPSGLPAVMIPGGSAIHSVSLWGQLYF